MNKVNQLKKIHCGAKYETHFSSATGGEKIHMIRSLCVYPRIVPSCWKNRNTQYSREKNCLQLSKMKRSRTKC